MGSYRKYRCRSVSKCLYRSVAFLRIFFSAWRQSCRGHRAIPSQLVGVWRVSAFVTAVLHLSALELRSPKDEGLGVQDEL